MHDVDQLLEQYEVTRIRSDTGSDHDAIDSLLFELALNDGLGRIAEVGQDCPVPARCAARLPDVLAEVI